MFAKSPEEGIILYLTVLIISLLLAMGLGLSTITLYQTRTIGAMEDSVSAFYAADTGIEKELYRNTSTTEEIFVYDKEFFPDDPERFYMVTVLKPGAGSGRCPEIAHVCVESVGFYRGTRRAIRITR